jgi:Xaa-Pro aminopeptidase
MAHAPTPTLNRRHQAIADELAARNLEALVVTALPNILYLTNFTGSSAILLVRRDRLQFITDFRYVTAVSDMRGTPYECPGLELVTVDGSYDAALAAELGEISGGVGFEAAHLTVSRHQWLTSTLAASATRPALVATEGIVEHARVRKDEYELAALSEGARRLSAVARAVFGEIRAGRTEREIAQAIDGRILAAGFSRPAFDTIVAGGPNAALPHAHPGERTLSESDLVVLDFGGVYDSYCVDLTRTVSVGRASARAREVHAAVLEAHDRAIAAVRPGQSRFAIDAAARDALSARGLGEAFGHGTGHGLGIEVHEDPRITRPPSGRAHHAAAGGDDSVSPGMVFTIEPGAYLAGWGGVRIEDDVLVTEKGVDVLTDVTTELLEL